MADSRSVNFFLAFSSSTLSSLGNVIALVSGLIAAGLFSHVSSKVLYINFIEGRGGPRLLSSKGRIIWGSTWSSDLY